MNVTKIVFNLRKRIGDYEHEDLTCEISATSEEDTGGDMMAEAKRICYDAVTKIAQAAVSRPPQTNGNGHAATPQAPVGYTQKPAGGQAVGRDGRPFKDTSGFAATATWAYDIPYKVMQNDPNIKTALKAAGYQFNKQTDPATGRTIAGWYGHQMFNYEGMQGYCFRSPQPVTNFAAQDDIPF